MDVAYEAFQSSAHLLFFIAGDVEADGLFDFPGVRRQTLWDKVGCLEVGTRGGILTSG